MSARLISVAGLGMAGLLVLTSAPALASTTAPTVEKVPILGATTAAKEMDGTGPRVTFLVHGVRRIAGASVLYYSAGLPEGALPQSWNDYNASPSDRNSGISGVGDVRLVDFAGEKIYTPLFADNGYGGGRSLTSPAKAWPDYEPGGTFYTFYAVLPELPADLDAVDVMLGQGDIVQNVPIEVGVLEPAVVQEEPIPMGEGWPEISPEDQVAAAYSLRPEESVRPLTLKTANADGTVTQESTEETTTVNLSSDVLFATDSDTLEESADVVLQKAADTLNTSATGGEIEIVGHTDSTGSDEHNLKLSRRRAQAVADKLKPLITVDGVSYKVSGQGEQDPVSGNDTEAGREKNRRVSVVFGQGGAR